MPPAKGPEQLKKVSLAAKAAPAKPTPLPLVNLSRKKSRRKTNPTLPLPPGYAASDQASLQSKGPTNLSVKRNRNQPRFSGRSNDYSVRSLAGSVTSAAQGGRPSTQQNARTSRFNDRPSQFDSSSLHRPTLDPPPLVPESGGETKKTAYFPCASCCNLPARRCLMGIACYMAVSTTYFVGIEVILLKTLDNRCKKLGMDCSGEDTGSTDKAACTQEKNCDEAHLAALLATSVTTIFGYAASVSLFIGVGSGRRLGTIISPAFILLRNFALLALMIVHGTYLPRNISEQKRSHTALLLIYVSGGCSMLLWLYFVWCCIYYFRYLQRLRRGSQMVREEGVGGRRLGLRHALSFSPLPNRREGEGKDVITEKVPPFTEQ